MGVAFSRASSFSSASAPISPRASAPISAARSTLGRPITGALTIAPVVFAIKMTRIIHRHDNWNIKALTSQIVINAVAWSGVHDARAIFQRHVIRVDKLARFARISKNRLLVGVAREVLTSAFPSVAKAIFCQRCLPAKLLTALLRQAFSKNYRATVVFDSHIISLRMQNNSLVSRQSPRRRGPNCNIGLVRKCLQAIRRARQLKTHINSRADLVRILKLGLRQRRMTMRAPMNWLSALVNRPR